MTNKRTTKKAPAEVGASSKNDKLSPIDKANEYRKKRDESYESALATNAFEVLGDAALNAALKAVMTNMPAEGAVIVESILSLTKTTASLVNALVDYGYYECEIGAIRGSETAAKGGAAKKANDKKAAAKEKALALWMERHAGKHKKLRTVELFAIEVMRQWPELTSPKVICGWSAKWTKDVREGRTPAC